MTMDSANPEFQPRSFEDVEHLDRRTSPRFSSHLRGNESVDIWINASTTHEGFLIDESLEGIGVACTPVDSLRQGRVIDVIHRGRRKQAEIRYIVTVETDEGEMAKLGLHWC